MKTPLMILALAIVLLFHSVSAAKKPKKKSCEDMGGTCVERETSCARRLRIPLSDCPATQVCCRDLSPRKKIPSRKLKLPKRKCRKTKKKCSKQGGTCIPVNDDCETIAVDTFCKGASCTCCLSDKPGCDPEPECESNGGFCIGRRAKLRDVLCNNGTFVDDWCTSRKCGCCFPPGTTVPGQCKCGIGNDVKVIGGTESSPHNYPWLVGLRINLDQYDCGGAIINDRYILTAAHCMFDPDTLLPKDPEDITAVVGDHNQNSTDDDIPGVTREVEVEEIIVHENYSIVNVNDDIALLRLKEPLDLSSSTALGAICLPENISRTYEGDNGTIAGWGTMSETELTLSDVVMEVDLPILDPDCEGKDIAFFEITEDMLCAGLPEGGKDSCEGDSGGPLMVNEGGVYTVVGITSFGDGCARPDSPGVYTRVTQYLDWIEANTADGIYCPE